MVHRARWNEIEMSYHSANTINPIHRIVDLIKVEPNPNKKPLELNMGDPSVTGVLNCHPKTTEAIVNAVHSGGFNGYGPATGFGVSCAALANHITRPEAPVAPQDVILTSGCSHALEIAVESIANPEKYELVTIADEIYGNMVYDGATFHPMATLEPKVPILSADGISKRLACNSRPAFCIGQHSCWARTTYSKDRWSMCPNSRGIACPSNKHPAIIFDHTRSVLSKNVELFMQELANAPGQRPIRLQGAMYIMVSVDMARFPDFDSVLNFVQALINEESVFTQPGTAFQYENAIRLVTTYPEELTKAACNRITDFCFKHYVH